MSDGLLVWSSTSPLFVDDSICIGSISNLSASTLNVSLPVPPDPFKFCVSNLIVDAWNTTKLWLIQVNKEESQTYITSQLLERHFGGTTCDVYYLPQLPTLKSLSVSMVHIPKSRSFFIDGYERVSLNPHDAASTLPPSPASLLFSNLRYFAGSNMEGTTQISNSITNGSSRVANGYYRMTRGVLKPGELVFPVSFAQFRLYHEQMKHSNHHIYNIVEAYVLPDNFNLPVAEWALKQLVHRHESLRTRFGVAESGDIVQIIQPLHLDADIIITNKQPQWYRDQRIDAMIDAEAKYPFNLTTGPLFRVLVIYFIDTCVLIMSLHHIISDGFSMGIIHKEFQNLYNEGVRHPDRLNHDVPFLPPLHVKYHQLAAAEQEKLRGEEGKKLEKWWKEFMGGQPSSCTIPYDKYPQNTAYEADVVTFPVPLTLAKAINRFSEKEGISVFTTLLTAFHWTLALMTNRTETVVGSAFANREQEGSEHVVGFFVNMLPTSASLSETLTYRASCRQINENYLEARAHQLPFNLIVSAVNPERLGGNLSESPLFQTSFTFQNAFTSDKNDTFYLDKGLQCPLKVAYDLEIHYYINSILDRQYFNFIYRKELYHHETIAAAADLFYNLINQVISDPEIEFAQLKLVKPPFLRQLCGIDCKSDPPANKLHTILQLFYQQVASNPNNIALQATCHDGGHEQINSKEKLWTYQALNRASTKLSLSLKAIVKHVPSTIAIFLDRSPAFVACMLAILKTGNTYLALDPSYPTNHLLNILDAAKCEMVISESRYIPTLVEYQSKNSSCQMKIMNLDSDIVWEDCFSVSATPSMYDDHPQLPLATDLAYILPTSGSTGIPKCCEITHHNLFTSTWSRMNYYQQSPKNYLLTSSLSFDSSVAGVYWTLCTGGTLLLPQKNDEKDTSILCNLIFKYQVTHILMIPSFLSLLLLENESKRLLSGLQVMIVAGEACPWNLPALFYACCPKALMYNEYGPTECTVWATVEKIEPPEPVHDGGTPDKSVPQTDNGLPLPDVKNVSKAIVAPSRVLIGKPIPDYVIFIVDALHKRPVGPSIIGEMYIAGSGVCSGYRAIQSEKFIAFEDLFASQVRADLDLDALGLCGTRLYKTGDIARWSKNGSIDFLGRCDNMAKINGFRIELEDIEHSILASHPAIKEAAVCVIDGPSYNQKVHAFLSLKNNETTSFARDDEERVKSSQQMYEQYYTANKEEFDGWVSSYNHLPYPISVMEEWASETSSRIISLLTGSDVVAEIGCGSGIILSRVASHCKKYIGMDFSPSVIKSLQTKVESDPSLSALSSKIQLYDCLAHELDRIEDESVTVVIINSVIQYFPSISYLLRVLSQANRVLKPGGHIFIGDVRSKDLTFDVFHFSLQLFSARDTLSLDQLLEVTLLASSSELELVISPFYWYSILETNPFRDYHVSTELKGTKSPTEMTLFRYDVTLTKRSSSNGSGDVTGHVGESDICSKSVNYFTDLNANSDNLVREISQFKDNSNLSVLYVENIPNSALSKENTWYHYVTSKEPSGLTTVGDVRLKLREKTSTTHHYHSLDSHTLYQLGHTSGLNTWVTSYLLPTVEATNGSGHRLTPQFGNLRAIFYKQSPSASNRIRRWVLNAEKEYWKQRMSSMSTDVKAALINKPYDSAFQSLFEADLESKITANLRHNMYSHAVPTEYTFLPALPRLPNGKLNRKALAYSISNGTSLKSNQRVKLGKYVGPSDSYEKDMLSLWEHVLNISNISMQNTFLDLGGNSLSLTFLRNHILRQWSVNLSFGELWDLKTPQQMTEKIKFELSKKN